MSVPDTKAPPWRAPSKEVLPVLALICLMDPGKAAADVMCSPTDYPFIECPTGSMYIRGHTDERCIAHDCIPGRPCGNWLGDVQDDLACRRVCNCVEEHVFPLVSPRYPQTRTEVWGHGLCRDDLTCEQGVPRLAHFCVPLDVPEVPDSVSLPAGEEIVGASHDEDTASASAAPAPRPPARERPPAVHRGGAAHGGGCNVTPIGLSTHLSLAVLVGLVWALLERRS